MVSYEYILLEKEDGIATITLNRPERLNALIGPMRAEVRGALEDADADESIRVVILTGAGRGFCSGADVGAFGPESSARLTIDEPKRELLMQTVSTDRMLEVIRGLNKPTICALNGVAAGAGAGIAVTCDILIASEQARFRVAHTRVGLPPGEGISFFLTRKAGINRALELVYTNDMIDAKEMERIGIANRVVPHDELMKTAKEMAKKMFQIPPLTLALSKRSINRGAIAPSAEAQREFDGLIGGVLGRTEDQKEARKSLIEKREPEYKGN